MPPPKIPSVPARTRRKEVGGNSAVFLQKIEAKPAALLIRSRTQQKSFLFLVNYPAQAQGVSPTERVVIG
ncbi:MAG: hypothetical protein A2759_03905 [Candidatus Taylorbacteria bacterium RIFCSPHIGHO2_01_FULL_49_60]|nr:MAG: hypothetical protein A2759_03905 [Candidatus Taylorbacteria bacterium RIFCSPHIGHO2_01_FULL_49_60]OHA46973.1 MAG: hypothetical protein A3G61_01570 [Candidatus Taylorbacteria bacterium RIFCSPLOWO2_12_FULL_49_67]